ncbi:hypothetical protein FHS21_006227 [Phyllobacterium trifolii]|uniref:Uncharacterized protein n=1 Tax=Phyllobacterium trifolii TaxID=300193 RepID=A0A839UJ39_9HYPH|nr:hypothetical protein [Phyllobacterium trifolii]MBB3149773.1 hypothetical protein [Phyllobacterium trifolii]
MPWRAAFAFFVAVTALYTLLTAGLAIAADDSDYPQRVSIPKVLQGPFVSEPAVVAQLDKMDARGCAYSGPLVFGCLIQGQALEADREMLGGLRVNPFNLKVAFEIKKTIEGDLKELSAQAARGPKAFPEGEPSLLNATFLTHQDSRVELVGVINRMDRNFIGDPIPGHENHDGCGEISVIYRFSYKRGEEIGSRLPVTMNVVFPAVPTDRPSGAASCKDVAQRWLDYLEMPSRSAEEAVREMMNAETGILSSITGRDIARIEINMQAYRVKVGNDTTNLGSTAKYLIRVFRWDPTAKRFVVSYLSNQIDRARLLGNENGDSNSCGEGIPHELSRKKFVKLITSKAVLADIDRGTLNIPREYLACRAVSVSPGGQYRSGNQPFWNANTAAEQIISDTELEAAMRAYTLNPATQFSFVKSPTDLRVRLNEATCSGCHQARAIAGFHFPGADRDDTPSFNAVYLPGSPQFYGDQPRRLEILKLLASGKSHKRYDLATSYSDRPLNKFKGERWKLNETTELLGGWGSTCIVDSALATTQRQWTCNDGLQCKVLFISPNATSVGTCVPESSLHIGDAMQSGEIKSARFGFDTYVRKEPAPVKIVDAQPYTLIEALGLIPPPGNSYYAAHQEYYEGDADADGGTPEGVIIKRDSQTGGFPAGMLRLSECLDLPPEATCGLVASPGFAKCITDVEAGIGTVQACFVKRTAYAGMRACDAANPCRDDYICLRSIGYNAENGGKKFSARKTGVDGLQLSTEFGQQPPDSAWLSRNSGAGDQRGICIPPYFVFQFRSDGHPKPIKY